MSGQPSQSHASRERLSVLLAASNLLEPTASWRELQPYILERNTGSMNKEEFRSSQNKLSL